MKKISKMIIVIPPYNRKCLILIGTRNLYGRILKYKMGTALASLFKEPPHKDDEALLANDTRGRYILWMPTRKITNDALQHEGVHLLDLVLAYVGEGEAPEYRAYFGAWFRKEVRKRLR